MEINLSVEESKSFRGATRRRTAGGCSNPTNRYKESLATPATLLRHWPSVLGSTLMSRPSMIRSSLASTALMRDSTALMREPSSLWTALILLEIVHVRADYDGHYGERGTDRGPQVSSPHSSVFSGEYRSTRGCQPSNCNDLQRPATSYSLLRKRWPRVPESPAKLFPWEGVCASVSSSILRVPYSLLDAQTARPTTRISSATRS